ncbi:MAG TPA: ATP-binding protein [Anaerolineales bacterium]|nr:ATP-binding protein [Anaerolineales bacterium]
MSFFWTIISPYREIYLPPSLIGRLVLGLGAIIFLLVIFILQLRWRRYTPPRARSTWIVLVILLILVPITSLFVGVRLPVGAALPPPNVPVEPAGPALMVFSALPWILAAGFLGSAAAALLAALSGVLLTIWDTHSLFLPLVMALVGTMFAAAINQRYRTRFYALLRHPFVTALLLALVYPFLLLAAASLLVDGSLAVRLDFALTRLGPASLAGGSTMLIAGLFAEIIALAFPSQWGGKGELLPSPAEKSLRGRVLYSIAPVTLILVVLLMVGSWTVAEQASRSMLEDQMAQTAKLAAEGIPYFLEAGQNLIKQLSEDPRLYTVGGVQLNEVLKDDLRSVPFFTQLYLLNQNGNPLAGYPNPVYAAASAPPEEQAGIQFALNGVLIQTYPVSPGEDDEAAHVSFIATIRDRAENIRGVLIGRTELIINPFSKPILDSLDSLAGEDGMGILLDDDNRILYHQNAELLMENYTLGEVEEQKLFDDTAPDGTRRLGYYHQAVGRPWVVILAVPASRAQQLALGIAAPLLGMILVLAVLAVYLLRIGLRKVTGSLQVLATQAANISQGQLDTSLQVSGEDEVGQMGRSFEHMRVSLKERLEEINRLLTVSQGVASSLEVSDAVRPILEAALSMGASAARVVLSPEVVPELRSGDNTPSAYGLGTASYVFSHLDEQILTLNRQQERLVLTSLTRPRLLQLAPGAPRPESVLALALRHENVYLGSFWVAYDQARRFSEEEVRFQATLASQAALAAAKARLYLNAEVGRQRLAAVLASTPDPVMVTDQEDRLMLSNPATWRALGLGAEWVEGQPVDELVKQPELLDLIKSSAGGKQSAEVALPDGKIYYATASTVLADGQRVGRVCILRDITYFKQLDSLKSEFVATVSHDLRSPLTLIRGYATMLDMVGDLNEQQQGYVRKIVNSVEGMARLVNNLLDLGRIEAGIGLQLEMVSVAELLERAISSLQMLAVQKRVQLSLETQPQTIDLVEADQALLQQALHNLIENAIKYTEPGGKVLVRANSRQDQLVFEIRDTGIGISPVDQPRLFEKFFRAGRPGSKRSHGTGLGLAIVKSIAERHAGKVWVESQLGKGSTFYISIPARQSPRSD